MVTLRGKPCENNLFVWGTGTDQPHTVYGGITARACRGSWDERHGLTACFCPVTDLDNRYVGEYKTERWSFTVLRAIWVICLEKAAGSDHGSEHIARGACKRWSLTMFEPKTLIVGSVPGAGPVVIQVSDTYGYLRRYTPEEILSLPFADLNFSIESVDFMLF